MNKLCPTIGIRSSPGIETVEAAGRLGSLTKSAPWRTLVAPSASSVIAIPTTIWSSSSRTQKTTMISETSMPAPIEAR